MRTLLLALLLLPLSVHAATHKRAPKAVSATTISATQPVVTISDTTPPPLRVTDATIPAAATGQSAAASLVLFNPSAEPIIIRGATSPVAQLIRLQHITKTESGLMQMSDLPRLILPPHTNAVLAPGATELRLLNLASPLEAGYETPLTLIFENGTTKTLRLHINE